MEKIMRETLDFKNLRAQARAVVCAYADGADYDFTISQLAAIGEKMALLRC